MIGGSNQAENGPSQGDADRRANDGYFAARFAGGVLYIFQIICAQLGQIQFAEGMDHFGGSRDHQRRSDGWLDDFKSLMALFIVVVLTDCVRDFRRQQSNLQPNADSAEYLAEPSIVGLKLLVYF